MASEVTRSTLDCGLTVVTERMPDVYSVAAGFWVGVGSRDEPDELGGASHFLEHLLFKGTETRSAQAIAEAVDEVGGDMNAFTTKEYTAFEVRLLDDGLEMGLDILSDIMWAPAFRPPEVEAERQVILEEIALEADEPADEVHDLFLEALFPGHPLGRRVLGDEVSIGEMTPEQIRDFHARHYRPANVVVAAAGNLDHDRLAAGVEARFCGAGGGEAPVRPGPDQPAHRLLVATRGTEQAHLVLGVRALDRDDPDRYALNALNTILGGGLSSRLFQEIRERRGLAYSVYSYRASFADSGALAVYAGTSPRHVPQVLELVHAELDRIAEAGVTPRELEVAKGHMRGSLVLGLEDSGARMNRIGRAQLVHGHVPPLAEVLERIGALTLDDLRRVAATVLANPRVLAVLGPLEASDLAGPRVA